MGEILEYLPGIILALSAMMLALMSPGPNILAVIGTAMGQGRQSGAALALGVATGTFLWALIAVTGLTALLAAYAGVLLFIKIAGGLYLIYLGYRSLRSAATAKQISIGTSMPVVSQKIYFRRGLTVQMTNPKAVLAMTAIVSLGVQGAAPSWVGVVLVAGITGLSLTGHLMYAYVFSTDTAARVYVSARRWIEGALGIFFCGAGVKLLSDRA